MTSRLSWFILGVVAAILIFGAGAYAFILGGGIPMATTAAPLPLEGRVASLALRASFKSSLGLKNPLPVNDTNLMAGANIYRENCAVCHGAPGAEAAPFTKGMFPDPPSLFSEEGMVTEDPVGETYWKVTHGIRLSGMPGFEKTLSEPQRWQATMVVANADKLPPAVKAALRPAPAHGAVP